MTILMQCLNYNHLFYIPLVHESIGPALASSPGITVPSLNVWLFVTGSQRSQRQVIY
jgi:hypothetical protein